MDDPGQVLLRADQVAARWGCSTRFVYDLASPPRSVLPRVELGRKCIRFRLSDVIAFESQRLAEPATA